MKKRISLIFIANIFLTIIAISTAVFAQNLNTIAAVVNNDVITQTQLNNAVAQASKQLAANNNPQAINTTQLKQMVLRQLIDEKLQLELAKQAKITVNDAEITTAIQHITTANHITLTELKSKLQQQGMSYASYRKMLSKQLMIHKVQISAIGNLPQVTAQDLKNALSQYQMQMGTEQKFHVIDNGHDLGWQTANTLPTLFLQQLSHMKPGDVSAPIQAPNGSHIIKLVGVHGAPTPTTTQLQNIAYEIKFQQAVKKWLKTIRKTAYIKIV